MRISFSYFFCEHRLIFQENPNAAPMFGAQEKIEQETEKELGELKKKVEEEKAQKERVQKAMKQTLSRLPGANADMRRKIFQELLESTTLHDMDAAEVIVELYDMNPRPVSMNDIQPLMTSANETVARRAIFAMAGIAAHDVENFGAMRTPEQRVIAETSLRRAMGAMTDILRSRTISDASVDALTTALQDEVILGMLVEYLPEFPVLQTEFFRNLEEAAETLAGARGAKGHVAYRRNLGMIVGAMPKIITERIKKREEEYRKNRMG